MAWSTKDYNLFYGYFIDFSLPLVKLILSCRMNTANNYIVSRQITKLVMRILTFRWAFLNCKHECPISFEDYFYPFSVLAQQISIDERTHVWHFYLLGWMSVRVDRDWKTTRKRSFFELIICFYSVIAYCSERLRLSGIS